MDEAGSNGGGDADAGGRECRKMGVDGDGGGKVVFMMSPEAAMRRRVTDILILQLLHNLKLIGWNVKNSLSVNIARSSPYGVLLSCTDRALSRPQPGTDGDAFSMAWRAGSRMWTKQGDAR